MYSELMVCRKLLPLVKRIKVATVSKNTTNVLPHIINDRTKDSHPRQIAISRIDLKQNGTQTDSKPTKKVIRVN